MAREVGDLWPQFSGSASLGAEMRNGGFTGEVRPFAHVHMSSGVWHGDHGASGVFRFGSGNYFELSMDGGKNYPLRVGLTNALSSDIQSPLGDCRIMSSGTLELLSQNGQVRIETQGAFNNIVVLSAASEVHVVNSQFQVQTSNGGITLESLSDVINLLANGNLVLTTDADELHTVGNNFAINADQDIDIVAVGSVRIDGDTATEIKSTNGNVTITSQAPNGAVDISAPFDILIHTLDPDGDITLNTLGGSNITALAGEQIDIRAWSLSGALNYQFGPYQSWYMKTAITSTGGPYNDGYWPIAHSGNVNEMITLQRAYNNGRTAYLNSTVGDMELVSDTAKLKLAGTTRAELNMSGVYTRPSLSHEMGDMWMMAHSALENIGAPSQAANLAEAKARALGLATIAYDTGSGIINVMVGSGIMQCLNSATMKLTTVAQTLPLVAATPASDNNYHIGTGLSSGVITILSLGLYKADYKVYSFKDSGTTPQSVQTNATLNGTNILGSFIYSFHYDNTTAAAASASASLLFNANAGDAFRLSSLSTLAGPDNCTVALRGAILVLQKIGPRRGTF